MAELYAVLKASIYHIQLLTHRLPPVTTATAIVVTCQEISQFTGSRVKPLCARVLRSKS